MTRHDVMWYDKWYDVIMSRDNSSEDLLLHSRQVCWLLQPCSPSKRRSAGLGAFSSVRRSEVRSWFWAAVGTPAEGDDRRGQSSPPQRISPRQSSSNKRPTVRMCEKNSVRIRFRFLKTEQSKNLTSAQTVYRYKLHKISRSNKK